MMPSATFGTSLWLRNFAHNIPTISSQITKATLKAIKSNELRVANKLYKEELFMHDFDHADCLFILNR